jgi:chemotaxis signal transduction protein
MSAGRAPAAGADTPPPAPADDARYLLVFRVDASLYALEGGLVDHVSELGQIARVPTAPACFVGIVHERGRVLPAVDLAAVLGAGPARAGGSHRRLVVAELEGRPLAVLAHEVLGLQAVAPDRIRPAASGDALAAGELTTPRGVVTLLDPGALLHRLRSGPEARHAS